MARTDDLKGTSEGPQGPSNHPDFALFLVDSGILVGPDSFLEEKKHVIASEKMKASLR